MPKNKRERTEENRRERREENRREENRRERMNPNQASNQPDQEETEQASYSRAQSQSRDQQQSQSRDQQRWQRSYQVQSRPPPLIFERSVRSLQSQSRDQQQSQSRDQQQRQRSYQVQSRPTPPNFERSVRSSQSQSRDQQQSQSRDQQQRQRSYQVQRHQTPPNFERSVRFSQSQSRDQQQSQSRDQQQRQRSYQVQSHQTPPNLERSVRSSQFCEQRFYNPSSSQEAAERRGGRGYRKDRLSEQNCPPQPRLKNAADHQRMSLLQPNNSYQQSDLRLQEQNTQQSQRQRCLQSHRQQHSQSLQQPFLWQEQPYLQQPQWLRYPWPQGQYYLHQSQEQLYPHQPQQQPYSQQSQQQQQASQDVLKDDKNQYIKKKTKMTEEASNANISRQLPDVSKSEKKTKNQISIPKRPDATKADSEEKVIKVLTNMFEIQFNSGSTRKAIHYDVKFTPDCISKRILRKVFKVCMSIHYSDRYPAFDGKSNAYSARDLFKGESLEHEVEIYVDNEQKKSKTYIITFQKVATLDFSWIINMRPDFNRTDNIQSSVQALEIIMRRAPDSAFVLIGRSLFPLREETARINLDNLVDLVTGSFSSCVVGWQHFYLNVDVAYKGFVRSQKVSDLLTHELDQNRRLPYNVKIENLNKFLIGLKVRYVIPDSYLSNTQDDIKARRPKGRILYSVMELGKSAEKQEFQRNGENCTVKDYFFEVYNASLKFPKLPCIRTEIRVGENKDELKSIYLPPEFCTLVGGAYNKKFNETQTREMILHTAVKPQERKEKILQQFDNIELNQNKTLTQEFHLAVKENMTEVRAKILRPPILQYCGNEQQIPAKGVWRNKKFKQPVTIDNGKWTIINLVKNFLSSHLHDLAIKLKQHATNAGMTIGEPQTPFVNILEKGANFTKQIEDNLKQNKNLDLIIIILPNNANAIYGIIKNIAELEVGVLTQCVQHKNIIDDRRLSTVLNNLMLKLNTKLNGINHTLHMDQMPSCLCNTNYMLVGADVSHPPPEAKSAPSIAAIVGTFDKLATKYKSAIQLQDSKVEMIDNFKITMINLIDAYKNETNELPAKIIYYRDGVSEGQFSQVINHEIKAMEEAFKTFEGVANSEYKPEITCVIVQKRHHVRMFPVNDYETDDRLGNVRVGTIIDTQITYPNDIDFYLVSHPSIKGTVRPTRYRCIRNESCLSEVEIEKLTYYLCHMCIRCTRAISYPAPTYYAHLAASRGKAWLQSTDSYEKGLFEVRTTAPMCFI